MVNTTRSTLNTTGTGTRSGKEDKPPRSLAWMLMGIGLTIHFLAFVLSFIAFFAPFWYVELNTLYRTGLWGRCNDPDLVCIWFNERNYAWEKSLPQWHIAAQILYAIGFGILILSMLASIGQIIFRCCKTVFGLPIYIGVFVLVAMLFELVSITVFGIGAYQQFEVSLNSWVGHFEWAFYVAIAALFVCTVAGLVMIHAGRNLVKEMRGYNPTPYG